MPIEKGLNLNTTLSTSADFDVNEENSWMSEPLHIVVTYGQVPHLTHGFILFSLIHEVCMTLQAH